MPSDSPRPPSSLTGACRSMLLSTLAYAAALALVAASIPALLAPLKTDVAGQALGALARVPAAYAPEPPR